MTEILELLPEIEPINLYAIHDRAETLMFIVAAKGAEHAHELLREIGLDWGLADTRTNRLWRNIDRMPGVVDAFKMSRFSDFRGRGRRGASRGSKRAKRGMAKRDALQNLSAAPE